MWFLLELHLEDCLNLNLITHSSCSIFEMIYTIVEGYKKERCEKGEGSPKVIHHSNPGPHLRYPFHLGRQHRALKPLRAGGVPTGKYNQYLKGIF